MWFGCAGRIARWDDQGAGLSLEQRGDGSTARCELMCCEEL